MEKIKIGFLGAGNMAQAIAGGMLSSEILKPVQITATARTEKGLKKMKDMGISVHLDNQKLVSDNNVIVLAVKPHILPVVLESIKSKVTEKHLLISVVNMTTNKEIEDMIGRYCHGRYCHGPF